MIIVMSSFENTSIFKMFFISTKKEAAVVESLQFEERFSKV